MPTSCKKTDLVDVFLGNGEVKTNPKEGIAATWHAFKGLSGNTHPGAVLPFGKLSVLGYSGGYSSGGGNNRVNSGEPIRPLHARPTVYGLSHLHHSGTGFIGYFYNYALTWVDRGRMRAPEPRHAIELTARPGYYAVTAEETGIRYEATTAKTAVYHRYSLPQASPDDPWQVRVELSSDGLYGNEGAAVMRFAPGEATLRVIDDHTVLATVVLQEFPLHFCLHCRGGNAALWQNDVTQTDKTLTTSGENGRRFGCVFTLDNASTADMCLTISAKSADKALSDNIAARGRDFGAVVNDADAAWEKALSVIDIEAEAAERSLFYSNLYHTLIKPSDWSGESFYYDDEDFLLDFITLWDIYKTQLPLLFSLYPDISRKLVRTYALLGEHIGAMPNSYGLTRRMDIEANQARLLAGYLFCDAYYRNVSGVDYPWVFRTLARELEQEQYRPFFATGAADRTTHTLDLSEVCGNVCDIAHELKLDDLIARLAPFADNWKNAFDSESGVLLADSTYYEGNHWNYAFRPLRDMDARISLCGSPDRFVALLDRFFGYTHPDSKTTRFEGFNNETDMEAPYAYAYTDRYDRLCEIIDIGMRTMFTSGEGGIPGNADSGGLTACFLWNVLGLFPVTGQDLMLIGTPRYATATLHLSSGHDLVIRRNGTGIYVRSATLDGERLPALRFSVRRMMIGGVLELEMSEAPA